MRDQACHAGIVNQQERRQEQTGGEDFLQKLRLGLFGEPEEA